MYKQGQHYFICDSCGMRFHSEKKRRRWDGLMVCPDDYEVDHPQKYIRVEPDGQAVPDPRPETDEYIYICYMYASHPYADMAEADCVVVGRSIFTYAQSLEQKGS